MSKFTVTITTDNAAFADDDLGPELARILRRLADTLASCSRADIDAYNLRDINGNRVGAADFYDDDGDLP